MRLLVTGGAGFLGRHVVAAALDAGHEVTTMSRHPDRAGHLPPATRLVAGDLTLEGGMDAAAATRPDAVIHAAAVVVHHDPRLMHVNVEGTARLCRALAALSTAPRLVHISSFAAEDTPSTDYSDSKLASEEIVRTSGLPWVILRPTLMYGRGDTTNTPVLVERMQSGTQWLPGGGATRIQPVHVDDVAAAALAAAQRPGAQGRIYRLGGADPVSVRGWREQVRDATGGAARIRSIPLPLFACLARALALAGKHGAAGVLQFHRADHAVDSRDAVADLGFAPRPIAAGLAETFGLDAEG